MQLQEGIHLEIRKVVGHYATMKRITRIQRLPKLRQSFSRGIPLAAK